MKKLASLVEEEECDVETDEIKSISECRAFPDNKTVGLIKQIEDCKPFIGVSVLFFCITIILIRIMIYFCLKLKNNFLSFF